MFVLAQPLIGIFNKAHIIISNDQHCMIGNLTPVYKSDIYNITYLGKKNNNKKKKIFNSYALLILE